jgi:hypothetical protein
MNRKASWRISTLPAKQELTIGHRSRFIDSQRDPEIWCIRWVIWSLIVEAAPLRRHRSVLEIVVCWFVVTQAARTTTVSQGAPEGTHRLK